MTPLIGKNRIINRLTCINNAIDYDWLNGSFASFKIKCKAKLLNQHIIETFINLTLDIKFLKSKTITITITMK